MTDEQAIQKMQSQLKELDIESEFLTAEKPAPRTDFDAWRNMGFLATKSLEPLLKPPPPPTPHRSRPRWPIDQDIRHFTASPRKQS